jgi:hypothetical protein
MLLMMLAQKSWFMILISATKTSARWYYKPDRMCEHIGRRNNQAQSSVGSLYFIWKEKHNLKGKLFLFITTAAATTTTYDNKIIETKQTLLDWK